jgi:hypothetical protein
VVGELQHEVPAEIALKRGDVDMIALMDPEKVKLFFLSLNCIFKFM